MKTIAMLGVALLTMLSSSGRAMDLPGPLVSPAWLAEHAKEVVIIDVRDDPESFTRAPQFDTDKSSGKKVLSDMGGHVPGALLLEFSKVRVARTVDGRTVKALLPERAEFEALMRDVGVEKNKPIIVVSLGQSIEDLDEAARTYWSLKVYGQKSVAILDGGVAAWIDSGQPVSQTAPTHTRGDWQAGPFHKEWVADSQEVADAAASKVQLVDARPLPFYLGLQKKPVVGAAGHIAGAVNLPTDVMSATTGPEAHFLSAAQYQAVFAKIGVNDREPSIAYCNTGHLAAGAWFVMSEVLGNKQVKLYDGSMHRWTVENRPVVGLN